MILRPHPDARRNAAIRAGGLILLTAALAAAAIPAGAVLRSAHSQPQRAAGYLGIEFHDVSDAEATALHEKGTRGVIIVAVDHDGPAGKVGLRPQDVIVSVNGQSAPNAQMLRRLIHDAGAGVSLGLSLVRQGQNLSVTATLADRGEVERAAIARMSVAPAMQIASSSSDPIDTEEARSNFAEPPPPGAVHGGASRTQSFLGTVLRTGPFTGLELEAITPQLAGFFGAPDSKGLLVQSVADNSPAAEAGIRAGDVLLKADGVTLHSTTSWSRHLRSAKGKPVVLTVLRDKQQQQITLTLDAKKHSLLEWPRPFHANEE